MRQSRAPETFRVKSFGCQMNVYDGERMAELLADKGMRAAPEGEDADLVVLNTCHIREKAAAKVYSDIGRLVKAGGESPPLNAVAGCAAPAEGDAGQARAPAGAQEPGPRAQHRLPGVAASGPRGPRDGGAQLGADAP